MTPIAIGMVWAQLLLLLLCPWERNPFKPAKQHVDNIQTKLSIVSWCSVHNDHMTVPKIKISLMNSFKNNPLFGNRIWDSLSKLPRTRVPSLRLVHPPCNSTVCCVRKDTVGRISLLYFNTWSRNRINILKLPLFFERFNTSVEYYNKILMYSMIYISFSLLQLERY